MLVQFKSKRQPTIESVRQIKCSQEVFGAQRGNNTVSDSVADIGLACQSSQKYSRHLTFCCGFEEEGRRHRIAFNSLYSFSFRSIIYEANGEELYNFTRGATLSWIWQYAAGSFCYLFVVYAR